MAKGHPVDTKAGTTTPLTTRLTSTLIVCTILSACSTSQDTSRPSGPTVPLGEVEALNIALQDYALVRVGNYVVLSPAK